MLKRKLIGCTFLTVALLLTGCSKVQTQNGIKTGAVETHGNKTVISEKTKKINIEELSMKVPKSWEDKSVENMLLYSIGEMDNFSISTESVNINDLDEYVNSAKKELSAVLKSEDFTIESTTFNGYKSRVMEYDYDVEGTSVRVYQVCFLENGTAYVLTLCSEINNIDENISILIDCLKQIKIK